MTPQPWLAVTPARDEVERLPLLARSLQRQLVNPIALWVIVDDGSVDGTGDLARSLELPFEVLVVRKDNDGGLRGGSAFKSWVHGVQIGLERLPDAVRVMKLDADVILSRDYFQALLADPQADAGLLGGIVPSGGRQREQLDLVPGFVKAYTRPALDLVLAMPREIGLDVTDGARLALAGLQARVVPTAHVRLARTIGDSEGTLQGRRRNGVVSRWAGYHPLYFAFRALRYLGRRPPVLGSLTMVQAYLTAGPGPYDPAVKHYLRTQQAKKLRALVLRPRRSLQDLYVPQACADPECEP